MKNLKYNIIHGKGFYKTLDRTSLQIYLDLKNIAFYRAMTIFSGPEVQGQVEPSNCTILQSSGKFIKRKFMNPSSFLHISVDLFSKFEMHYIYLHLSQILSFINGGQWNHGLYDTIGVSCGGDSIVPGMMNRT